MKNLLTIPTTALPTLPVGSAVLSGGQAGSTPLFAGPCRAWFASMWTKLSPVTVYAGGVWPRDTRMIPAIHPHAINHARRVA